MKKKKYPFIPLSKKGIVSIFSAALLFSAPLAGPSITMAEGNGTDKVIFDENLEWMKLKTAMNGKTLTINFSDQFAAMGADTVLEAASDKQSVQAVFDKQVLTLTINDFGETTISVTAKNSKQTVTNTFKVNVTKKGDINGDGTITPADSLYIYQVISGKVKLSSEQQKLLDINGDGKITNLDATTLMSSYVGKNVSATIEENSFVQLTEINDSPVAVDDTYTLNEDEQLKVNAAVGVLANDIDPENKELTATVTTNPENGKLTFNEDGSFQYVPSANFVGKDRFAYKASDGNSTTEAKTVTINVLPVNDAPVSKDGVLNTQEDTVGIGTLLGEDVDGDTLTYTIVENGKKGKVTILDQKTGVFSYKPNANENGEDFFTYKVSDGKLTSTAKVSVFIKAVNDAPTAKSDAYSTKEDETLTVSKEKSVLLNDEDVDKDSLKAVLVKGTAHGTLDFKADGTFTYIPAKDFNGSDSFVYKATDGVLESAEQTVVLSVGAVNDAPVAKDSSLNVTEDEAASGVVQASDADKDTLTFAIAENGQKGKAVLTDAETGKFTYTPDKNANGEDNVVFTVTDGQGEPVKATVSISIKAVNDAPTAASDSFTTKEDEKLTIEAAKSILNNDMDVDNDALEAILVKATAHGKLELNKDGTFTYTPDKDYSGKDSFTYKATDGKLESAVQTVGIEVKAVNDTPTAKDSSLNVTEDEAASGVVQASDADKDKLTFAIAENGQKGKAVLTDAETGKFTYTPDKNANGEDKIVFTVTDGQGEPVKATVSISIKAVNDAPTAASDSFTTKEDEKLEVGAANSILNNDADVDNDALEAILVKATAHGKLELNKDGTFTYTPDKDYSGKDSFTYKATDGKLESAVQTVEIEVKAVNDTPTAKDSSMNVTEDEAASGVVEASDTDKDKLTFAIAENGQKGKAVLTDAETGNFTYTPDKNANGEDKVVFTVTDGQGEPVKATVSISIKAVNDAPTAASDSFTTNEEEKLTIEAAKSILNNDADVDNDALEAILMKATAHGKLELNKDGTFTYTPDKDYNGSDSFTYKATDGKLESAVQTVEIEVKAVNDTPTAKDSSMNVTEDEAASGVVEASDADKDTLTFAIAENGQKGKAVLTDAETGNFTYTPDKNANGEDKVVFTVTDGKGEPVKATVSISIKAVNDAPTAASDSFTTNEDEKLEVGSEKSILVNDEDVDNDNLQAILVKGPANGLLVLNADGTFTYTPDKDYSGKDSFTYKATDGKLESAEQTVEIEVKAVNDTPTADASSIELEEDGSFNGKLTGTDPEGDSLIFSLVENGSKGTAVITNEQTGAFTYTPSKDANGTDSFTFKVNDGNSDSEKATVEVTIKAVNDAPTASDVKLEGTARVGETLTGTYSYHDVENDAEEQSTFQWYSGDKEDGSDKTKIAGATSNEYKITNTDLKKYLFFEVKPAAATGEQSSESYLSNASEKVKLADSVAPTIVSTTPANSASEVGVSDDLVITMSENVLAGSGKIEIKNSDGSTFAEYEANDTQHVVIDGATITIKHPDFAEGKEYSIVVGSNAFVDEAENAYVNNNNEWKFETEAAPGLTAYADPSTPLEEEAMKQMFGAFVYVDISGDSFKDGLTADDIILNNVPAGVTVMDQYVMGNNLTLVLGYDGTDFDTKFSNFTVTIKGTALEKGNDLTSNSLEFVPSADAPTPIITEYLHGGDGRSAIEIYSPTPTTEPYKLKIYSLDKGVRKTSEIALRLQYADVNPFLIIDSIFYEYFDIVPNVMYYNEEATLDRGTNIVNALQIIAPNGTVVDTLGDPASSTPIVTGSVTMVRNTDIKDGIDRYVPSQWNTYTSDIYNHFSKRD
ncbi:tandem-95 repeat protein [Niallia taxi]|uniref:tandem-95 repeat protein n=1 Tax=Niallia taxi TaxID=2499688 RepID=UPI003F5F468B